VREIGGPQKFTAKAASNREDQFQHQTLENPFIQFVAGSLW
jgi:hypothetical protein